MKLNIQTSLFVVICLCLFVRFIQPADSFPSDWVKHAQNLIGLNFSDPEIDSLLPALGDQLEAYTTNRSFELNNEVLPALRFNPLPINFKIRTPRIKPVFTPLDLNAKDTGEYAFMSIHQLASLIKSKKLTSLNLTRYFLARLKKVNSKLNCVINYTEEYALAQAALMDTEIKAGKYRGLLHGIPYGAKDLLAKKGYPTTWGSVPFKDQILDYDAAVIQKLETAGAILIAKMSVGELAWGDIWFGGMTRNPWDTTSGSSGSSAGSASAVSAGAVPFAIGTETLGSIVSPSTICGTTGLRPTFGAVPGEGCMKLCPSMDKIGPITRSAEDAAIIYHVIQGKMNKDPVSANGGFPFHYQKNIKQIRIGYLRKDFEKPYSFHLNDSLVLDVFKQNGIELIPIELPKAPDLSIILSAEAGASFDELTRNGKDDLMVRQIRNAWPNVFRASRFIPAVEYIQANRLRTKLIEDMDQMMQNVDVYLAPSWSGRNLNITNYTGHPCVVVPNGFRNKRPTSISFIGKLFNESQVLEVAKFYQDHTNWHKEHPMIL